MGNYSKNLKKAFGSQIPIRERFFNIIFSAAVLIGITGVIACMSLGSSRQAIMVSAAMTLAFPLLAYIGIRAKHQTRIIYIALVIVNFFIFPALYLSGGAINCGIPSYFVIGLALTLFLTTGVPGIVLASIESLWYAFFIVGLSICPEISASFSPVKFLTVSIKFDINSLLSSIIRALNRITGFTPK